MSTPFEFTAWEWVDAKGVPQYVGVGKVVGEKHPADAVWASRNKVDSHLTKWLRSLKAPPKISKGITDMLMHKQDAKIACQSRRDKLAIKGVQLLSSRPFGTSVGGGAPKGVVSPDGELYESVRAAADDLKLNPCTITRRCNSKKSKWRYVGAKK